MTTTKYRGTETLPIRLTAEFKQPYAGAQWKPLVNLFGCMEACNAYVAEKARFMRNVKVEEGKFTRRVCY